MKTIKKLNTPKDKSYWGNRYIVNAVKYCSECGVQTINVSGSVSSGVSDVTVQCGCGSSQPSKGLWWTNSRYFIRPIELTSKLRECVENEDYETASELRDIIKTNQ